MRENFRWPFIIGCIMVGIGLIMLCVFIYERIACNKITDGVIVDVYEKEYTDYNPSDINRTRKEKRYILSINGKEHNLVEGTFNHYYAGQRVIVHYSSKNSDLYWIEGEVDTLISDVLCVVIGIILMVCFKTKKS